MATKTEPTPEERTEALANCLFLMITATGESQEAALPALGETAEFLASMCTSQEIERAKAIACFRAEIDLTEENAHA